MVSGTRETGLLVVIILKGNLRGPQLIVTSNLELVS